MYYFDLSFASIHTCGRMRLSTASTPLWRQATLSYCTRGLGVCPPFSPCATHENRCVRDSPHGLGTP